MKWIEKLSSKMAKTASTAVKDEVRNTALDLLPTAIGIGGMIIGVMIFKDHKVDTGNRIALPQYSTITINNYYFGTDDGKEWLNEQREAKAPGREHRMQQSR